jgi:hypothetical protein
VNDGLQSLAEDWEALLTDCRRFAYNLLCGIHHDVIDGDVEAYPIARLVAMKQEHERAVDDALSPQKRYQDMIEIRYAAIVDEWARLIDIDHWEGRMSRFVAERGVWEEVFDALAPTRDFLLRRVWPRTIPPLEDAFLNYRRISEDLESVAGWQATRRNGRVLVDRVYKEVYGEAASDGNLKFLRARSEYTQDLAADLTIELTRAVNLICDRVREYLWPTYRLAEGYSTIGLGMNEHLTYMTLRPLYAPDVEGVPYPGLEHFLTQRADRDYARGSGCPPRGTGLPGIRASLEVSGDEV